MPQPSALMTPRSPYSDAPSSFAECARHAVLDRLHQVLKERSLAGFDEDFGRHTRRRIETANGSHFLIMKSHANDIDVARSGLLRFFLIRDGIGGKIDNVARHHRRDSLAERRQPDHGLLTVF